MYLTKHDCSGRLACSVLFCTGWEDRRKFKSYTTMYVTEVQTAPEASTLADYLTVINVAGKV